MSTPATQAEERLELLLQTKDFPPPAEFAAQAEIVDPAVYEQAAADPQAWWAGQARSRSRPAGRPRPRAACRSCRPPGVSRLPQPVVRAAGQGSP